VNVIQTDLPGAYLIELERLEDARGYFARAWCTREAIAHGLQPTISQCNLSSNRLRGTLRGMHYQVNPHGEDKLVRCTRGAMFDVITDLRPDSPTYRQWRAFHLDGIRADALYVPKGFAHGFQTLEDDTDVYYQMSEPFHADSARGFRWNDPAFAITWPLPNPILSVKDAAYPDFAA